ncbi:hypothetical protein APY04_1751 [Hyphomicrobium sulfonivorans]|uniref:Uncharacterized protein n=1 Tax=Hyphomicrobium sulfonivorans TaxID=121290 RepID=A0A109BHH2_HYPSL|nr:hypothetical protein APY04_1751 [Hyphomicrobium sulfonivorans]
MQLRPAPRSGVATANQNCEAGRSGRLIRTSRRTAGCQ